MNKMGVLGDKIGKEYRTKNLAGKDSAKRVIFCFARPEKVCRKECSGYSECPKYLDKFCMKGGKIIC